VKEGAQSLTREGKKAKLMEKGGGQDRGGREDENIKRAGQKDSQIETKRKEQCSIIHG